MKTIGPDKMNQMNLSGKRESDYIEENRRQKIHQRSVLKNTIPHDDIKKQISFIHPMNWKLKEETGEKSEKIFQSITDQIKKKINVVKGRKNCKYYSEFFKTCKVVSKNCTFLFS